MKRWPAFLLLLLLPLTMAPRTSLDTNTLDIHVTTPRDSVRVGSVMPVTVEIVNDDSEATALMPMVITVTVEGHKESVEVQATTRGCLAAGATAGCWVPPLEPGASTTLRLTARPLAAGVMTLDFTTHTRETFGTVERRAVDR